MLQASRPVEILLIEDNSGDVELTQEAFASSSMRHRIHCVSDGEEALAFLRRQGAHAAAPRPDVILLDLGLPKVNGDRVLEIVKGDPELRLIPIIVLTGSDAASDVVRSYKLNANCYISKPADLKRFLEVVRLIEDFWLKVVKLPESNAPQRQTVPQS